MKHRHVCLLAVGFLSSLLPASQASPPATQSISIPPTSGRLSPKYSAEIAGRGSRQVGAIRIRGNTGTIEIGGSRMQAVIEERIAWSQKALTLYQGMAFDSSHWQIFWIYCNYSNQ